MKTIVLINGINYSSTGTITLNIAKQARKAGYKVYTCCKDSKFGRKYQYEDQITIGTRLDRVISERLAYITGLKGYFNIINTWLFIRKLNKIKPDLIHMHLLHDTFINLNMFFKYLKRSKIPVIWTFHDCWAFTGQCSYFDLIDCQKWKTGCYECKRIHEYPSSLLDQTSHLWKKKKKMFSNVDNMMIVTPSKWLIENIKLSFLKDYKTDVIYNGINLEIFKPTESDFRQKYKLEGKFVVLGVSYGWSYRKGIDVFIKLSKELPDSYKIVMVGVRDIDQKQLPDNIITIKKTFDQKELAQIYTACDLFINPTREDNFPTVNIESLACGTPVLTFKTGGSPEALDEKCGDVVEKNDYDALKNRIIEIAENRPYTKENCLNRARQFDMKDKFNEYVQLYDKLLNR